MRSTAAGLLPQLLLLGVVSGLTFPLTRIAAGELSPFFIAALRAVCGGLLVLAYGALRRQAWQWRGNMRSLLWIAALNFAAPFLLYAYAAATRPAAYTAVLNATAPLFSVALSARFLGERLSGGKVAGLLLGAGGVVMLSGAQGLAPGSVLGVLACLAGALCYVAAGVYARRRALAFNVITLAGAGQCLGGLMLLPFCASAWPAVAPSPAALASLAGLVALGSAVAYVLYFRILLQAGPSQALLITLLAPVFACVWAYGLLGEMPRGDFWLGAGLILLALCGVTGWFAPKAQQA